MSYYTPPKRESMWDFPDCKRCGAKSGKSCRTPAGRKRAPHRERYVAAVTGAQLAATPTSELIGWLIRVALTPPRIAKNRAITATNAERIFAELDQRIPPRAL
jgi:hypothetical protein